MSYSGTLYGNTGSSVFFLRETIGSSNINRTPFLKCRDSRVKQNHAVAREGLPITVITYCCMCIWYKSVVIAMSEQVVPSAVAKRIITFLTNKNVKRTEIWRFSAQFGDETLSRTQVYDWSKSFKDGRTEVENVNTTPSSGKVMNRVFCDFQSVLFMDILIEQRSIKVAYYSKPLLKIDQSQPFF